LASLAVLTDLLLRRRIRASLRLSAPSGSQDIRVCNIAHL
jgi:hypothetical protein